MNKDLLIDGEKYISAKRAQENLGYSSDYIGQLARSGAVPAKMVGRSWYVSRKSLLEHKKKGSPDKSPKVGRPVETGKKDIYINGDKFVSSIRAAKEFGYATDYIGQLARSGALPAKMMGRTWYVSRKALLGYRKNNSPLEKVQTFRKIVRTAEQPVRAIAQNKISLPKEVLTYSPEAVSALPKLNKEKPGPTHRALFRNVVSVSLSLAIISGVAYSWVSFLSPETTDKIDMTIATAMDAADGVLTPVQVGSSHLALALGANIKGFFTGILSGVLPVSQTVLTPGTPVAEGVVVASDNGTDHSAAVSKIKSLFSDEVNVSRDEDGTSGVITPVFSASTSTESYTYVLVPIKPKQ